MGHKAEIRNWNWKENLRIGKWWKAFRWRRRSETEEVASWLETHSTTTAPGLRAGSSFPAPQPGSCSTTLGFASEHESAAQVSLLIQHVCL